VVLVRTNVSAELIASVIRVKRIRQLQWLVTADVPLTLIHISEDGSDTFLRNVGSYKSHTA
jgi:hypothetical protein